MCGPACHLRAQLAGLLLEHLKAVVIIVQRLQSHTLLMNFILEQQSAQTCDKHFELLQGPQTFSKEKFQIGLTSTSKADAGAVWCLAFAPGAQ